MSKKLLVRTAPSLLLPPAVVALGQGGPEAFVEFFTVRISNHNTRAAYLRAVVRFCAWIDEQGLTLGRVQPVHVAATG